jgi:hypothetical protein
MADNFLRETPMTGTPDPSNTGLYPSDNDLVGHYAPKGYVEPTAHSVPRQRRNHKWWIIGGVLATLVVIGAVLGGVLGTQLNKKSGSKNSEENKTTSTGASGSATGTSASASPTQTAQLATGTDGSTIKMDSGVEFTYSNKFGGSWAVDPSNPYNVSNASSSCHTRRHVMCCAICAAVAARPDTHKH